jgi:hypothetical protein
MQESEHWCIMGPGGMSGIPQSFHPGELWCKCTTNGLSAGDSNGNHSVVDLHFKYQSALGPTTTSPLAQRQALTPWPNSSEKARRSRKMNHGDL